MRSSLLTLTLVGSLASCAAVESALDYPLSFFDDEGTETTAPLGDVIADQSGGAGSLVQSTVTGLTGGNAMLGVAAGAAAAALFGRARRKKKATQVVSEDAPAEEA